MDHAVGVGSVLELSRRNRHLADFQWHLPVSEAGRLGRGVRWLDSPRVSFAGSEWELELGLIRDPNSKELHLCLYRYSGESSVIRYWMRERTGDEEEEIGRGTMETGDRRSDPHPWLRMSDIRRRMQRSAPSSDTLSISLRLWTGPETDAGMESLASNKSTQTELKDSLSSKLDSLCRDFEKLLADRVFSDVNLKCGDRTMAAHKAILAARSSVFSAMFQSRMSESETGDVDIADVDVQILEMFLKYVYTGRLTDVPDELLPGLYAVGDKYAVSPLRTACSEQLISNLTRENCLSVLILADTHMDQDLQNAVFDFILNHVEILKSQEWRKFCKENPPLSIEVLQFVVERQIETKPNTN